VRGRIPLAFLGKEEFETKRLRENGVFLAQSLTTGGLFLQKEGILF
jgi:hypothetical protein